VAILQYVGGPDARPIGEIPTSGERLVWRDFVLVCEEVTPTSIVKVRIAMVDKK